MSSLLLALTFLVQLVQADGNAVPVDFYVFLGKDGDETNVSPRTSMNIKPPDNTTGFPILCKDRCPVFTQSCGSGCTSPQMRWCPCIAELLVKDLTFDFSALLGAGASKVFTLGDYVEVSEGQEFFHVTNGHDTLFSLMDADSSKPYARRSGRLAVWVSHFIAAPNDPNSILAGTTLLDQPLWQGGPGAGVLLSAQVDRSSKVLSHEVGHVVGFHHTAGPSLLYKYDHPECPKEYRHVEMHPLIFPSCEVNIMGYWYDGPYCCPGAASASSSFLLQLRAGRAQRQTCLPNPLNNYQEAHCCGGNECSYSCPKQMPEPKFDTKEHEKPLAKMLHCWLHLRTVSEPKKPDSALIGMVNATSMRRHKSAVQCFDYGRKWGSCVTTQ